MPPLATANGYARRDQHLWCLREQKRSECGKRRRGLCRRNLVRMASIQFGRECVVHPYDAPCNVLQTATPPRARPRMLLQSHPKDASQTTRRMCW
jgi:hypothetical protein